MATLMALTLQAFLCWRAAAQTASVPWAFRGLAGPVVAGAIAIGAFALLPAGPAWTVVRLAAAFAIAVACLRLVRAEMELARA